MDGWQPIETAPKDGTEVILGVDWEPLTVVGFWCKKINDWCVAWDKEPLSPGFNPITHWMPLLPLPAPPEHA